LLNQAEQQAAEQLAQQQAAGGEFDNRGRLNNYWMQQDVKRSKNVVSGLGSNFDGSNEVTATPPAKGKELAFNKEWLEQNRLQTEGEKAGADRPARPGTADQAGGGQMGSRSRYFRGEGKPSFGDDGKRGDGAQQQSGQKAPEIANQQQLGVLQQQLQQQTEQFKSALTESGEQAQKLSRYQQRLDDEIRDQQRQPKADLDLPFRQGQFNNDTPTFGGFDIPGGGAHPGQSMGGGGIAPSAGPSGITADPNAPPVAVPMPPAPVVDYAEVAAGLASLDVALPERGRVYSFIVPRGDLEITARSISFATITRLIGLAGVAIAIVIVWALGREKSRRIWIAMFGSFAFGIGLILLGLVSILFGLFPFAGLLALVIGIALAIRARLNRPAAAGA
ncbi:MAG TPA: hypothetical protein VFV87_16500, partial [Pirellulaceae bacterium]|nr:hypothetical protein [Pirellulaceae bacterium]